MVNEPLQSTVVQLSRSAVAGKPFTVSEVNHPFPNEYAAEGIPILAAYAAWQDWDGVFWYTLAHRDMVSAEPRVSGHFDLAHDPVKMCQLTAGALMFVRGDAQSARRTVIRSYTMEQVRESIRLPAAERPYFTPGFPLSLPLQHAMRIGSFEGPATGKFEGDARFPIRSDTGELAWFISADRRGLVTVNTPRWQALVGFCGAEKQQTENMGLETETPFSAVTLSAMDDQPITKSSKLLLTACAGIANSNMQWNDKRVTLENWGNPPTVIEPVTGKVLLRNLSGVTGVTVQALDGGGRPLSPRLIAEKSGETWRAPLGEPATTWYLVTAER
jgi:hypothetical protein